MLEVVVYVLYPPPSPPHLSVGLVRIGLVMVRCEVFTLHYFSNSGEGTVR